VLFTGDHAMQGSTVVINPPDGEMAAYFASLRRVADEAGNTFDEVAPGHGFLIGQPQKALQALIAHRRQRESKVRAVLADTGAATIDTLLPRVYDDVAPSGGAAFAAGSSAAPGAAGRGGAVGRAVDLAAALTAPERRDR
jgi:glyoxylase-like metal-dependent hydrolase (beta-lactamase superfamily II)